MWIMERSFASFYQKKESGLIIRYIYDRHVDAWESEKGKRRKEEEEVEVEEDPAGRLQPEARGTRGSGSWWRDSDGLKAVIIDRERAREREGRGGEKEAEKVHLFLYITALFAAAV